MPLTMPASKTWVDGEYVSASVLNTVIRDTENFLGGLKRNATALAALSASTSISPYTVLVEVTHGASQSFSSSETPFTVSLNTDTYDADGFHDTATNNNRLTVPAGMGGLYYIFFNGVFATSGGGTDIDRGQTGCIIRVNAVAISERNHATCKWSSAPASRGACANKLVYQLAAGDYVDFQAWQKNINAITMSLSGITAAMFKLKD